MKLYDEEEFEKQRNNSYKTKKIIIGTIIILTVLTLLILFVILYRVYHPNKITVKINNNIIKDFETLLDIHEDENGNKEFFLPIRDIAEELGYKSFNGEYKIASEDKDKCYAIKEDCEVAMFSLKSKTIYKKNLQSSDNKDYSAINIDKPIFENNGKLYASVEGIESGFNLRINYNDEKKELKIETMEYLIEDRKNKLASIETGFEIDDDNFENYKAIFDNMLIVKSDDDKTGVINAKDFSTILEAKYDNIQYIQHAKEFLIENNGKYGIISKDGKTKVSPNYEELSLIDKDSNLYIIKKNGLYGVIDNEENVIIHPENENIGIDIDSFSYNGIKSGYILLNQLIPVQNDDKWGFYTKKGKMITDGFIYDEIGCEVSNGNNIYSLLEIPDYNMLVVGSNGKYTFMDEKGNDDILPFVFTAIYIKISSGNTYYYMDYNEKQYDVLKYLEQKVTSEK